jgi:hypothetical protein
MRAERSMPNTRDLRLGLFLLLRVTTEHIWDIGLWGPLAAVKVDMYENRRPYQGPLKHEHLLEHACQDMKLIGFGTYVRTALGAGTC